MVVPLWWTCLPSPTYSGRDSLRERGCRAPKNVPYLSPTVYGLCFLACVRAQMLSTAVRQLRSSYRLHPGVQVGVRKACEAPQRPVSSLAGSVGVCGLLTDGQH